MAEINRITAPGEELAGFIIGPLGKSGECVGQDSIAVIGCTLVPKGGGLRCVSSASHEFDDAGPGCSRPGEARVAQVRKRRSGLPMAVRALCQARLNTRLEALTTSASGDSGTKRWRCAASSSTICGGTAIVRLPARVFGSVTIVRPDMAVVLVTLTERLPAARSISLRRKPRISPRRSWHHAAR